MSPAERIRDIEALVARRGRGDDFEARALAEALTRDHPNSAEAWSVRAYVESTLGHAAEAASMMARAVALQSNEPDYHWTHGDYLLQSGDYAGAVAAADAGLGACADAGDGYYVEALTFLQAVALALLGRASECRERCRSLPDGKTFFVGRVMTKADVLRMIGDT